MGKYDIHDHVHGLVLHSEKTAAPLSELTLTELEELMGVEKVAVSKEWLTDRIGRAAKQLVEREEQALARGASHVKGYAKRRLENHAHWSGITANQLEGSRSRAFSPRTPKIVADHRGAASIAQAEADKLSGVVEYVGQVNNGEAAAPTWPRAALGVDSAGRRATPEEKRDQEKTVTPDIQHVQPQSSGEDFEKKVSELVVKMAGLPSIVARGGPQKALKEMSHRAPALLRTGGSGPLPHAPSLHVQRTQLMGGVADATKLTPSAGVRPELASRLRKLQVDKAGDHEQAPLEYRLAAFKRNQAQQASPKPKADSADVEEVLPKSRHTRSYEEYPFPDAYPGWNSRTPVEALLKHRSKKASQKTANAATSLMASAGGAARSAAHAMPVSALRVPPRVPAAAAAAAHGPGGPKALFSTSKPLPEVARGAKARPQAVIAPADATSGMAQHIQRSMPGAGAAAHDPRVQASMATAMAGPASTRAPKVVPAPARNPNWQTAHRSAGTSMFQPTGEEMSRFAHNARVSQILTELLG